MFPFHPLARMPFFSYSYLCLSPTTPFERYAFGLSFMKNLIGWFLMILLICPPIECWQTLSDFMRQNGYTQYLELEPKAGCRRFRFIIGPTDRTHGADSFELHPVPKTPS